MIRRLIVTACAATLLATPALAERRAVPPAQQADTPTEAPDTPDARRTGVDLGQRLATLGAVRDLGDRLELTIFAEQARDPRVPSAEPAELVAALAETAAFLQLRTVVITAHAPAKTEATRGLLRAQQRAQELRVALERRGVQPERIRTTAAPPLGRGVGAVDVVISFERPQRPSATLADPPAIATR